jgi:hypothetical protein
MGRDEGEVERGVIPESDVDPCRTCYLSHQLGREWEPLLRKCIRTLYAQRMDDAPQCHRRAKRLTEKHEWYARLRSSTFGQPVEGRVGRGKRRVGVQAMVRRRAVVAPPQAPIVVRHITRQGQFGVRRNSTERKRLQIMYDTL